MTTLSRKKGFTLIEAVISIAVVSILVSTLLVVLTTAHDALQQGLVGEYVRETGQSVLGIIESDIRGLVYERTCAPADSEDFQTANFDPEEPAARAAAHLSLIIIRRDYVDASGVSRPADMLFLQTTGAGDAEGGRKVNPVCRVLYSLCADDGDGDRSDDPAIASLSQEDIGGAVSINLHRCVWYSHSAFSRLELPDAIFDDEPPVESLLARDVVAFEVRLITAAGDEFERRTLVFPNTKGESPAAIEIVITLRDPYTHKEHELRAAFSPGEMECY